jgi:hypothetical protein
MSVSDDIGNLFQRFGGNPDRYQEVARDDDAKHAASRWPLLSALDIAQPEQVPGAGRPAPAMSAVPPQQQPLSAALGMRSVGGGVPGASVSPAATQAADEAKQTPDVESAAAAPTASASARAAASAEGDNVTHDSVTSASPRSPLFARGHRHAMMPPPVDVARQAASRFSPPPQAAAATASEAQAAPAAPRQHAQPAAGTLASVMPASAPTLRSSGAPIASALPGASAASARSAPAADPRAANDATRAPSRQPDAGFFANRKQTFAPAPIIGAPAAGPSGRAQAQTEAPLRTQIPAQSTLPPQTQTQSQSPMRPQAQLQSAPQPAPQSPTQRSILSGLFAAPPAHEPEPSAQPAPRELTTVFARLAAGPRRDDDNRGGERS